MSRWAAVGTVFLIGGILLFAMFWFFHLAPPGSITITTGTEGSVFQSNAVKYSRILLRNGVQLRVLPSEGSAENLQRLNDPKVAVDIGFVQGGVTNAAKSEKVVSLGSISYEPLLVFYRGTGTVGVLSEFKGKRIVIGPEGSGTRSLALALLKLNGIEPGDRKSVV